jgi:hypothetical protein
LYGYFTCRKRHASGGSACTTPPLPAGEIEKFVFEKVGGIGTDPALRAIVLKHVRAKLGADGQREFEKVDEAKLVQALERFGPVWESLSPKKRSRMLRLLVDRIEWNGGQETVSIVFQPTAIETLT